MQFKVNAIIGLVLVGIFGLLALLPAPHDPNELIDPAISANRPPGTRLIEVHLADGQPKLAESTEIRGDQLVLFRRGGEIAVDLARVTNLRDRVVEDERFFLLGSDKLGRDVWSRIMEGARVSLLIASLSVLLALTFGIFVGALSALGGPVVDALLMRAVDAFLSFPQLFLVIALAAIFQPSTWLVIVLLGGTSWMQISRLTRAQILSLAQRDFILASRGLGQGTGKIFFRHLLPNCLTVLLVEASLLVGDLILAEAGLSYFGLGVQPPTPSWGSMVSSGSQILSSAWWVAVFPGIAIALTVIGCNLLSDTLRDHFDPRTDLAEHG